MGNKFEGYIGWGWINEVGKLSIGLLLLFVFLGFLLCY